jgi:hypothetical protein
MHSQYEIEEGALVDDLNAGRITRDEFNKQMRELSRSYRADAEESAQQAYDSEMARW